MDAFRAGADFWTGLWTREMPRKINLLSRPGRPISRKRAALPWDEIRAEFEGSDPDVTYTSLGEKYGCDRRMIMRTAVKEGWVSADGQRDARGAAAIGEMVTPSARTALPASSAIVRVANRVAVAEVIRQEVADEPPEPEIVMGEDGVLYEDVPDEEVGPLTTADDPPRPRPEPEPETAEAEYTPASQVAQEEEDEEQELAALIVKVQAQSLRRQLRYANRVQKVSMQVIDRIGAAVPDLQEEEAAGGVESQARIELETRRIQAITVLTAINPDRETMSGLLASAIKALDTGMQMERRALGLTVDARGSPRGGSPLPAMAVVDPGATAVPGAPPPPLVAVKELDDETVWKMRTMLDQHMKQRRTAEIQARQGAVSE